jgi:type I restriction enzyme S subunit
MGSTHKTIYQAQAAGIRVCVPPLEEQRAIVDFIQRESAKIDELVDRVEHVSALLKEFRSALIAAAVTGELDVREAA